MKLPISIAEKLILLQTGEKLPFSKLKHSSIESMLDNGILKKQIQGRSKSLVYLVNVNSLVAYLKNHYGIDNLENYVEVSGKEELTRADLVSISSDSKLKSIRSFKGFLVNCYSPVQAEFNNKPITILPIEGMFNFIYDFEKLIPSPDITIVGIENPENFRHIFKQKYLFENIKPLFVSRYPQNQSKDLIKWLKSIPNNYLHFGDFDFAGLNIYRNEYKKHLKTKSQFFLPEGIEHLLSVNGNRKNYNIQKILFEKNDVDEENILILLSLIEKYKKGLEQEILIKN